ncbi:MAG: retroviral-like aspartic protease family protein [Candidatus Melainabacteria bacterium]|nr:retroviral-like aspartic protease family protein [Candidatus Melainabacteria bacterium]
MTKSALKRNLSLLSAFALNALMAMPSLAIDNYDEGVKLFQKKSYEQSAKEFERVLAKDPKNEKAIYYAGLSCQYMGDNKRALEYYKDLIVKFPDSNMSKYLKSTLKLTAATTSLPSPISPTLSLKAKDFIPDTDVVPYIRNSHRQIVVTCRLNNITLPMIFDTGAEETVVGKNHLLSLGIVVPTGKPTGATIEVNRIIPNWSIPIEMQLGKIRKTIKILVYEKSEAAILGKDFLNNMEYNIDRHSSVIRFHKCGSPGGEVPVDAIQIPFKKDGKDYLVDVNIGGFQTKMCFESGTTTTLLSPDMENVAERQRWKTFAKIPAVAGYPETRIYIIPEIKSGEISRKNLQAVIHPDTIQRSILGQDFFGNRQFVIDENKKIIFFYRR